MSTNKPSSIGPVVLEIALLYFEKIYQNFNCNDEQDFMRDVKYNVARPDR